MRAGREFRPNDNEHTPFVVVVNDALVQKLFPAGNAVGQALSFGGRVQAQIVGVVNDTSGSASNIGKTT